MTYLVFVAIILLLIAFLLGCFAGAWFGKRAGGAALPAQVPTQAAEPELAKTAPKNTEMPAPTPVETEPGRPPMLDEPRGGVADKLTRVKGIGPVNEKRLHDLGIYHFDQIAAWSTDDIAWIDTSLSFKGRIAREDWVGQAARLAKEG